MFPNLYFCLYRDLTFVLLSIMKKDSVKVFI